MKKMDEMELSVTLQGVKWSWAFGIISLAIYNIYLAATTGERSITSIIMAGMFLIRIFVPQYKLQKINQDNSFWRMLAIVGILVLILLGIVYLVGLL